MALRSGRGLHQDRRIGMRRAAEEGLRRRCLHDPAQVEHHDAIGHDLDDREVVADEHQGQAKLALQVLEEVNDLRLDRYVKRRDRFVRHDEPRLRGERSRDRDALALPAREGSRIAPEMLTREADLGEQDAAASFASERLSSRWSISDSISASPTVMRALRLA